MTRPHIARKSGTLPWFRLRRISLAILLLACASHDDLAAQRITFSIDVQGPTAGSFGSVAGIVDSFYGHEIDGGDILTPGLPVQPLPPGPNLAVRGPVTARPGIVVFGINPGLPNSRSLNLTGVAIGSRPELEVEIDALSFGRDEGRALFFSVDEFSGARAGDVAEQALQQEAAADVFRWLQGPEASVLTIDGEGGERPNRALGLGLVEPNPPNDGIDGGDNLDALDVNTVASDLDGPIFFSLDASFDDPLEQPNAPQGPNLGSAQLNNFSAADILVSAPGLRQTQVFLSAQQLGLNPMTDDVDALALLDANQNGVFDPEDNVRFSVRRGSQIVGQIDSAFGFPIVPGDILTLPNQPNQAPQILVPAEALGLVSNRNQGGIVQIAEPTLDDLDALSLGVQDGDMNCNFDWDTNDVPAFALALESSEGYESSFFNVCFGPAELHGDLNLDGRFGFQDIEDFVRIMHNAGTLDAQQVEQMLALSVPEPRGQLLIMLAVLAFLGRNQSLKSRR